LKTKKLGLLLVPAVSAALLALGCGDDPASGARSRACVDAQGRRVADNLCNDRNNGSSGYHWYHIAHGGSFSSASESHGAASSPHPSGISRGGFGSSAHASAHAGG